MDGLESKEVIFFMNPDGQAQLYINDVNNPYGMGDGILYNAYIKYIVSDKQINAQTIEIQFQTVQYHLYVPSKKDIRKILSGGSLPQAIIFGSETSGDYSSGFRKMNPNKKTLVIDFSALQEVMNLITIGMSQSEKAGTPSKLPEPEDIAKTLREAVEDATEPEDDISTQKSQQSKALETIAKPKEENKNTNSNNQTKPAPIIQVIRLPRKFSLQSNTEITITSLDPRKPDTIRKIIFYDPPKSNEKKEIPQQQSVVLPDKKGF